MAAAGRVVEIRACAKINLILEVLGRRTNGYHDIRSVVMPVCLHDTLTLTPADDGIETTLSDGGLLGEYRRRSNERDYRHHEESE